MDVNQQRVQMFLAEGYSFICATCEKLHRARATGYTAGCEAQMLRLDCAGPISGMDFPLYEGPLTKATKATICYRCGDQAQHAIQVKSGAMVGACDEHLEHLRTFSTKALVEKKTA